MAGVCQVGLLPAGVEDRISLKVQETLGNSPGFKLKSGTIGLSNYKTSKAVIVEESSSSSESSADENK
jgi:hypothetical protein